MLENLFKLLNEAQNEGDIDKKLSIFEEYSECLKNFLHDPENSRKYPKSELNELNLLHAKVLKEVESIFSSFKDDIKNFQKKNKGIKAYIGMPKKITACDSKKG